MLVSISSYRERRSGAEDPQAKCVDIGPLRVWFSYSTPVAFRLAAGPLVVRRNDFSRTTGAHLNAISRNAPRVSGEEFEVALGAAVRRAFFPRDLDTLCPAPIVADWLDDKGFSEAAEAVRNSLSP